MTFRASFKLSSFFLVSLLFVLCSTVLAEVGKKMYKKEGPRGMPMNKSTSCQEFSKNARFNPHSIVNVDWFVFYYWAPPISHSSYKFIIPGAVDMSYIHYLLDNHVKDDFNWSAPMVLIEDHNNFTNLLVQHGDRGQYWFYVLYKNMKPGELTHRFDLRLKQTSDNKYIGLMECESRQAFIMSRMTEVPPQKLLQEEASKLGYRGRKGKSYLYQGSEWAPIPDMDEKEYWRDRKLSNMNKNSTQNKSHFNTK